MCGYQYSYIIEQVKKARNIPIVISVDPVSEGDDSEDDMDVNDDVHVW